MIPASVGMTTVGNGFQVVRGNYSTIFDCLQVQKNAYNRLANLIKSGIAVV